MIQKMVSSRRYVINEGLVELRNADAVDEPHKVCE